MRPSPPFLRFGPIVPVGPVVVSVPHAGRDYPAALRANLRASFAAATSLEDRHVDAIALAACKTETVIVQQRARAWIDLNRHEGERDTCVDEGALASAAATSAKLRSGLGLIPRRGTKGGELWRRRWTAPEVEARIVADYRPYHDAVAAALAAARARWGTAVLLDLHSMPPLAGGAQACVVIGDRFGRAAASRFVHRVELVAAAAGFRTALNAPYAGGQILERHGAPADGIHAIQLELDRSLYLDRALDHPDTGGLANVTRLVRAVLDALVDEVIGDPALLAAE